MSKCLQVGLTLSYAWLTAFAFLLMLRLSGVYISGSAGWLGIAGWWLFCFSSSFFLTDIRLFFRGKYRKPILEEEEKLQRCLREVVVKTSIDKTFRLMIEEEMALNAFATGHHTIVVTRGLLVQTVDDELKGILAHELGHLADKDPIVGSAFTMASLLPQVTTYIYKCVSRIVIKGFFPSGMARTSQGLPGIRQFSLLSGVVCLLLLGYLLHLIHLLQAVVPVLAFVPLFSVLNVVFNFLYFWVSRFIEYKQDAYAYRLGYGPGLRQALQKLAADNLQPVSVFPIILKGSHPVIYNRIRRLEKLERLRA